MPRDFSRRIRRSNFLVLHSIHRGVLLGAESVSEFVFLFKSLLGSLKLYAKHWENFLNTSEKVEKKLHTENFTVRINFKLLFVEIAFYHLVYFTISAVEMKMNSTIRPNYITHKIAMYYQFFELILICNTAKMLRKRYNFLSKMIRSILKSPIYIVSKNEDKSKEEKLKKVFSLYQDLYVMSDEFNVIFGWKIFLILICTVFSLLNHANRALLVSRQKQDEQHVTYKYIMNGLVYPLLYVVTTVALVMSCDSIEKSGDNVITTCHRKLINLDKSPLRNDLQVMAKYMDKLRPTFTAAGFFQINQLILATIFTSITTYLIIIIQFQ
ncbi:uncharacterized protein [Diabrotica undecimpunctata]|uniref:uncharacterized protein n=1 Tax=Diabrotica undecimpunctata TaxID=50387 RepID=UPI003B63BA9D